jgi:hypothetical protein
MKHLALALLFLPGGLLLVATLAAVDIIAKIWTGIFNLDALAPAVAAGVLGVYKPVTQADWDDAIFAARALQLIANAESSYGGAVGDTDPDLAPGGPSISPWQIERKNAIAMGWYTPPVGSTLGDEADRASYAGLPTRGPFAFLWAARAASFFRKEVAPYANHDFTTALVVWNGGPSKATQDPPSNADYAQRSAALIADWSAAG